MNKLVATVDEIEERGIVTYIRLNSSSTIITIIKSKTPKWIGVGDRVHCKFQETSVSVSKDCQGKISIENRLPGILKEVRENNSLCELTFESDIGNIISLITSRAYNSLELSKGCKATILLRGVDIKIEPILLPIETDKYKKITSRIKDAY